MQRQVLTEQSLFYGDIDMPKGCEIDLEKLLTLKNFHSQELGIC